MHITLRSLFACAALAACGAQAQDYPTRPVRVLVPYTPGGITDLVTRITAANSRKVSARRFVVDNRPGANSILAVDMVSKATPDGYTLGTVIAAHAANQTLYAKLPYDSVKSFEHVSLLVTSPLIVCATNSLAATSIKELIDLAKAKPGQLTFASSGIGAAAHLTTELFMSTTGIKMVHVPYKGTAPALQDLIGGQINFMMDTPMPRDAAAGARRQDQGARHGERKTRCDRARDTHADRVRACRSSAARGSRLLAPAGTPAADSRQTVGRGRRRHAPRPKSRNVFAQLRHRAGRQHVRRNSPKFLNRRSREVGEGDQEKPTSKSSNARVVHASPARPRRTGGLCIERAFPRRFSQMRRGQVVKATGARVD